MILYNPTVSGSLLVTGSLTTTGTLTAQTLVVQTITSSVDFVTGSSINGSLSSNTHQFTGSVLMSGSVGIGTSSPSGILDVIGTNILLGATSKIVLSYDYGTSANSNSPELAFYGQSFAASTSVYGPSIQAVNQTTFSRKDLVFYQHNAADFTNRYEAMRLTYGGNVGIGTSTPSTKLHVEASSPTRGIIATIKNSTQTGAQVHFVQDSVADWVIGQPANTNAFAFWNNRYPSNDGTEVMRIDSNGNVYIGTTDPNATNFGMALLANGEIDISRSSGTNFVMNRSTTNGQIIDFRYNNTQVGSISTNSNSLPSDLNFKKDISDILIGLNLITKLRPVHYRHKMDEDNEALSNGIIAQELEQSLLDCGIEKNSLLMLQHKPNEKENESQYWVDYTKMIPVLVKAIQELKAEIDTLKQQQ